MAQILGDQSSLQTLLNNLHQTISSAGLRKTTLPLCPELQLWLLQPDFPRDRLPHDEMLAILNQPAYWAFCWASGQVLARYVLDHREAFRDRVVVDFGSGSGVVAIAAALAGACRVIACDIDPMALDATACNAELNGVVVETLDDINRLDAGADWIIAADVLYDRENYDWIERLPSLAVHVLIADSRVSRETLEGYTVVDRVVTTTVPDLDEFEDFNRVSVYQRLV